MTSAERAILILEALPEKWQKELTKDLRYMSPEAMLSYVNNFVNARIPKSAENPLSVRVYAAVCGLSEEEMKARLILDGFF